ncbi:MAG: ABC transporter permease subunit [Synergistaceae bacterium]|nr:ABC transporter permease subunit [Synergistaceae bacterium]
MEKTADEARTRLYLRDAFRHIAAQAALPVIALALWHVSVTWFDVPEWQIPSPPAIIKAMGADFRAILPHLITTYGNVLVGFTMAAAIGIALAIAIYFNASVGIAVTPFINLMCIMPLITLVPLLMLWLGFGSKAKLVAVVIQSFPIINLNALSAFAGVNPLRLELMESMKATKYQKMRCCILPDSLPGIFTGVKLAAVLALTAEVTSEITGGNAGLGARIIQYTQYMKMPQAFACVFYIAAFGLIFYQSLSFIERKLTKNY